MTNLNNDIEIFVLFFGVYTLYFNRKGYYSMNAMIVSSNMITANITEIGMWFDVTLNANSFYRAYDN